MTTATTTGPQAGNGPGGAAAAAPGGQQPAQPPTGHPNPPANANANTNANANANAPQQPPQQQNAQPAAVPPIPAYVPTYYTGQLPAPTGPVARAIDTTTKDAQRQQAVDLHSFLLDTTKDLRQLNHEGCVFTALVMVPGTQKVKVLYGMGVGTAHIGQTSPIDNKMLALMGEGGQGIGVPQALMFDTSIRNVKQVKIPTAAMVQAAFRGQNHAVSQAVAKARDVENEAPTDILTIAPILAYLVYDGLERDLDAALVYERVLDSQHFSQMRTDLLAFLRACMVGTWRQTDTKPYMDHDVFLQMLPLQARQWSGQRFKALFPMLAGPPPAAQVPLPPAPQGAAPTAPVQVQHPAQGVFNFDAAALRQLLQLSSGGASGGTEEKKDDDGMKVSEKEKVRMRHMCGLPDDSEAFPKWFRDLFDKHQSETDKLHIISTAIRTTFIFEDADVPLYPTLLKTALKRDWTGSDLGLRPSYVAAAKGLSPFAMIDFSSEDIAVMNEEDSDITRATAVSTSDLKASRAKLAAVVPDDGDSLMLMMKMFGNMLYALFGSQSPLYKQVYNVVAALRSYSRNARKNLPYTARATVLWVTLLQARKFARGEMIADSSQECLGEFVNMLNMLTSKNCASLSYADMPDELRLEPAGAKQPNKRQADDGTADSINQGPTKRTKPAFNKEMVALMAQPLKDAGNPSLYEICQFCGTTVDAICPPGFNAKSECRNHLVLGECRWWKRCRFDHKTATTQQVDYVRKALNRFITDPLGFKTAKGGLTKATRIKGQMRRTQVQHQNAAEPSQPPTVDKGLHEFQSPIETSNAIKHCKEVFGQPDALSMTPEEQTAAIREAFSNDDTVPNQRLIREALGKEIPSLVLPRNEALLHAAGRLIEHYAKNGCPVDCGPDWSIEHIEETILRGAHPSADSPEAMEALHAETTDKVKNGYARLVRYGDLKKNMPKKLKISPVAMIPHKSRLFRTILDLSFRMRLKTGKLMESVNSATVKQAPAESMVQLGQCVQRLVAMLADNYDPSRPFRFAKLDIKDGFWRMAVSHEDAWNFCYVLPSFEPTDNIDDTMLVVPSCLQMGWCESPPFFCAASETARDVIQTLLSEVSLPPHDFEDMMMPEIEEKFNAASERLTAAASFVNLVEVFVDDFIGCTNQTTEQHLEHFSRAMLHGIHSVFPPPDISGHQGEDPVSQKKLKQGEGLWETTKEILGWLVDGANFTIQLMPEKCEKIVALINKVTRMKRCALLTYQELAGKLQHASFAIPGGKGLFSPIHRALSIPPHQKFVTITKNLKQTLQDWLVLVKHLATCPTPVQLLVSDFPNIIQYTDACGLGAGGVITPGMDPFHHFVWQFEWPDEIKRALISATNPKGTLTINDLELAGLVLGWLVLEFVCGDLRFKHVGSFCDNTSAVAWALKGHTTTSLAAGRLLRFLALRQRIRQVSTLVPMNIAGKDNAMADIPSRAFKNGEYFHAQQDLVHYFNTHFPLPQNQSWLEYRIPANLTSRVISCLHGELQPMAQLLRLPKLGRSIGASGRVIVLETGSSIPTSRTLTEWNKASSSSLSRPECGPGLSAEEIKSVFKRSRMRSRPSPRPSNWLENKVPSSKERENTFFPSNE